MYTELVLKCDIKGNAPKQVKDVLDFLFLGKEQPTELPDHEFFSKGRWTLIGNCSSYYHHPEVVNSYIEGHLFSRSDIKNYESEIEAFLDWLMPYVDDYEGRCIGWSWYEEADVPTLILVHEKQDSSDVKEAK